MCSSLNIYSIIKPLLFKLDEERAHKITLSLLGITPKIVFPKPILKPREVMGINFPHMLGLGAGFDKNAAYLPALDKLGFAFIEIGTVTPKAQPGNLTPRLFRLPKKSAIINRMGFNNAGVDVVIRNILNSNYRGILGINIGKNKATPLHQAINDYRYCLQKMYQYASYITINISSPNTKDLRKLQEGEFFANLIRELKEEQLKLADKYKKYIPLAIKISPDETLSTLKNIAEVVLLHKIDAIIATNTTSDRSGLQDLEHGLEEGGVSGKPLFIKSLNTLKVLKELCQNKVVLIGAGGIDSIESAQEKLSAGASLLQIYTGLIYQGPNIISKIVDAQT